MMNLLSGMFIVIGAFFTFIAGLGLVRFPDIYTRMHAASKSMSLGIGSLLLAAMIHFADWGTSLRLLVGILFLFLTIPVASQVVSYVAYLKGVPLWKGTTVDEFSQKDNHSSSEK